MKKIMSFVLVLAVVLSFTGCGKYQEHQIKITIPAGTTEEFVYQEDFIYSEEEISTNKDTLTVSVGDGLGDMQIVLAPTYCEEENAYEAMSITPGSPVEIDVEKGAWFKIGIAMQNDTDKDIMVDVTVSNVIVRVE